MTNHQYFLTLRTSGNPSKTAGAVAGLLSEYDNTFPERHGGARQIYFETKSRLDGTTVDGILSVSGVVDLQDAARRHRG